MIDVVFRSGSPITLFTPEGSIYESIAVTPRGTNVVITKDGRVYELTSENFDRSSN